VRKGKEDGRWNLSFFGTNGKERKKEKGKKGVDQNC
jgi:hypothetical protein